MRPVRIAPSILAADFLNLGEEIRRAEQGKADRLHLDVMDGRFVPNISFGMPVIRAIRGATSLPLEVHLMIVEPERYVEAFADAGADIIIIHQEVSPHLDRSIQQIKECGKLAGVAINPSTPAATIEEVLEKLDYLLVMTVNPGFGGQHFIGYTMSKLRSLRHALDQRNPQCDLSVDGGIDPQTAPIAIEAGADVLVAGTAVFRAAEGVAAAIARLRESGSPQA